jgi:CBS domain containing-hemolysin-like protein
MLGHGEKEGTIDHGEREIIERVFLFHDLKARDVMTPQNDVFSLAGSQSVAEALPQISDRSYTRIPLYDKDRDNLYKVLYLRDLLTAMASSRGYARLDEIAHDPIFVPQYQPIDDLFARLLRKKRHLAIVVDEYGVVRGIVTLEDLLEELVGEIYDESDIAPSIATRISEDELAIDGSAELRVVEEFFDLDLPGKPTDTVSFWILTDTESLPEENAIFTIDGLEVKIAKASARRIDQVNIRRPRASPARDSSAEFGHEAHRDVEDSN